MKRTRTHPQEVVDNDLATGSLNQANKRRKEDPAPEKSALELRITELDKENRKLSDKLDALMFNPAERDLREAESKIVLLQSELEERRHEHTLEIVRLETQLADLRRQAAEDKRINTSLARRILGESSIVLPASDDLLHLKGDSKGTPSCDKSNNSPVTLPNKTTDVGSNQVGNEEARRDRCDNVKAFTSVEFVSSSSSNNCPSPYMEDLDRMHREALADHNSSQTEWFNSAFGLLNVDLGPEYITLLRLWISYERKHNFDSPKTGFTTKNRPSELSSWIQNSRKGPLPQIRDATALKLFSEKVWVWWCSLQPGWRPVSNNRPTKYHSVGTDWTTLDKPGRNGWLGILTCLLWWKRGLENLDEECRRECEGDWLLAVEDMRKMFEGLYQSN